MRSLFFVIARFALVAATMVSARASAEPTRPLELAVHQENAQAARCWSVEKLRERIAHYAQRAPEASGLHIEVEVRRDGNVEMKLLRDGERIARRVFTNLPARCTDRRDVVALSIALTLERALEEPTRSAAPSGTLAADGGGSAEAPSDDSTPVASPDTKREPEKERAQPAIAANEPTPAVEPPRERASEPATASEGLVFRPHLGVRGLLESLPSPVLAATIGVELQLSTHFSVDAAALASLLADTAFAGGTARTRVLGGELLGCYSWRAAANLALRGCLGVAGGACFAQGEGYAMELPATTMLLTQAVARVAMSWPEQNPVALRLWLQGHANLVRPALGLRGSSARLRPELFGGSAGLDVVFRLP